MQVKFITTKGSERLGRSPFYVGLVQHERTMSRRETYEHCAERTGYKATAIRAVFMALAQYICENQRRGNITYLDGVVSIRNYVKGAFQGLSGPWVKGVNHLSVQAVEMDPFKSLLAEVGHPREQHGGREARNPGARDSRSSPCTQTECVQAAPPRRKRTSRAGHGTARWNRRT